MSARRATGLGGVRALLVDLSGTVHVGSAEVAGAVAALDALRARRPDLPVRFVTNTTKESQARLTRRLVDEVGFRQLQSRDVFSCLTAARLDTKKIRNFVDEMVTISFRDLVERRKLRPMLLLEDEALEVLKWVSQLYTLGEEM